jgi:hypothetical protein
MVNFELTGGVSFTKGCYPGQEIVARSQYLGKLKRRMFAASASREAIPGEDILVAGAGEPCGRVVISAPCEAGRWALLYESPLEQAQSDQLTLTDGVPLVTEALPYTLPATPEGTTIPRL